MTNTAGKRDMTDTELIARQAKQIEEFREELADLKERVRRARSHIYCIGGPLNDNKLEYSSKQLMPFARIAEELEDEDIKDNNENRN